MVEKIGYLYYSRKTALNSTNPFYLRFLILVILTINGSVFGCEIGVIKIVKGKWTNRDSIINNCENCYKNDPKENANCRKLYIETGENHEKSYLKLIERYRKEWGSLQKRAQKIDPLIFTFFQEQFITSGSPKDTIQAMISLKFDNQRDMYEYQSYEQFLLTSEFYNKQFKNIKSLTDMNISELNLQELAKRQNKLTEYISKDEYVDNSEIEKYVKFLKYLKFSIGTPLQKSFEEKAKAVPSLNFAYKICCLKSNKNSIDTLLNLFNSLINLKQETIAILLGFNYTYNSSLYMLEGLFVSYYNDQSILRPDKDIFKEIKDKSVKLDNVLIKIEDLYKQFKRDQNISFIVQGQDVKIDNKFYSTLLKINKSE